MVALALAPDASATLPVPRLDQLAIERAILAIEGDDRALDGPALDAVIYAALGWVVRYERVDARRAWRCHHPLSSRPQPLPACTALVDEARRIIPWRWAYGSGVRGAAAFAWCAPRWPIREGVPFFETSGRTEPRAVCKAALHAHRWMLIQPGDPS